MQTLELIDQVMILLTGPLSVWLVNHPKQNYQKWGCFIAFVSQPFWFHAAWIAGQWGIFVVDIMYTYAWWTGFRRHWIRERKDTK